MHNSSLANNKHSSVVITLLLLLFVHFSLTSNTALANSETSQQTNEIRLGQAAPDFTLKSFSGENIRLNELQGNVVIITFWASWSGTSVKLISDFENLYQKYKEDDLKVISISINPDKSENSLKKLQGQHLQLLDTETRVSREYQIHSIPSIFVIDRDGTVILKLEGYDPRYRDLVINKIESLILEP